MPRNSIRDEDEDGDGRGGEDAPLLVDASDQARLVKSHFFVLVIRYYKVLSYRLTQHQNQQRINDRSRLSSSIDNENDDDEELLLPPSETEAKAIR